MVKWKPIVSPSFNLCTKLLIKAKILRFAGVEIAEKTGS